MNRVVHRTRVISSGEERRSVSFGADGQLTSVDGLNDTNCLTGTVDPDTVRNNLDAILSSPSAVHGVAKGHFGQAHATHPGELIPGSSRPGGESNVVAGPSGQRFVSSRDEVDQLHSVDASFHDACGVYDGYRVHGGRHAPCDNVLEVINCEVICDVCDKIVRGNRFKCVICTDYDLCGPCKGKGYHSYHEFKQVLFPLPAVVPDVAVVCNYCGNEITEKGHQCLECPDFDLCSDCFSSSRGCHPHRFRSILPPHVPAAPEPAAQDGQASIVLQSGALPQEEGSFTHNNVRCDTCGTFVTGMRFKCGNCDNFNLCSDCEAKTDHDQDHVFLKIRRPVALEGVLLKPLYAPLAQQETTAGTESSSPDTGPTRVESLAEALPSVNNTEMIGLQLSDQATASKDPGTTATSETQTTQTAAVGQKDGDEIKTIETANTSIPAMCSRDSGVQDATSRAEVVEDMEHEVEAAHRQASTGTSTSAGLAFDAPGETEVNAVDGTGLLTAVAPLLSAADIEDEFVMVSTIEGQLDEGTCLQVDATENGLAEVQSCAVEKEAPASMMMDCSSPSTMQSSPEMAAIPDDAEGSSLSPVPSWCLLASPNHSQQPD